MEKLFLLSLFIVNIFSQCFILVHSDTISICSQTPYPELCNSLVSTESPNVDFQNFKQEFNLRDTSIRVTLAQATNAHKFISMIDKSSFNELEKSAWDDCSKLYEDTIDHLNNSIGFGKSPNLNDAQTWLSASFANQQTCQNGFIDFNLSSHLQSFFPTSLSEDLSKYLSNSLAINKAMDSSSVALISDKQIRGRRLLSDGLPEWVLPADRKLLQSSGTTMKADIVVAQDGSGNYKTINEALSGAAKKSGGKRFVIYVKKGVYNENVEIEKSMSNLMFIGDGIDETIVVGKKNVQDGSTTLSSATFGVTGNKFIARGMTFENTAGPQGYQAVALRANADLLVFYQCSFKGYQDTLYVHSQRQFYRECDIYGTIDFIFGDAIVVFQKCNIYVRKPMSGQKNTITAQGRTDPNEITGIIIHDSSITAASDLRPVQGSVKSYLGRPWQKYSRTVYVKSNIDSLIDPAGWLPWSGNFALNTLYYGEYLNTGSGSGTGSRVNWPGYHVITSEAEATKFSVGNFLVGNSWLPSTGVSFTSGL